MSEIIDRQRTIYLVRHGMHAEVGKALSGRSEISLNDHGQTQAYALADSFSSVPLLSVHTSPRVRALETADPLARSRELLPTIAPALDEIDFGAFTGRRFDQLAGDAAWTRWNAERDTARCPGGETMAEAVERAYGYVERIPSALTPAVCVTHCDIIRGIVARLLGLPFARMFALECAPASVTTLAFSATGATLVTLNAACPR